MFGDRPQAGDGLDPARRVLHLVWPPAARAALCGARQGGGRAERRATSGGADQNGGLSLPVLGAAVKLRDGDQPLPVVNDGPDIQSMVVADIIQRRQVGIERYGTALQAHNGRDMLRDAYEEALDLSIYLRGCLAERDGQAP